MSSDKYRMNRLGNCRNPFQGSYKKVLCVCSAGLLRSPTAAVVLSQSPYNFNTRAAGIVPSFALVSVDEVLLTWADEVVCMTQSHREEINKMLSRLNLTKEVICLDIEDSFSYRDSKLIDLIKEKYNE